LFCFFFFFSSVFKVFVGLTKIGLVESTAATQITKSNINNKKKTAIKHRMPSLFTLAFEFICESDDEPRAALVVVSAKFLAGLPPNIATTHDCSPKLWLFLKRSPTLQFSPRVGLANSRSVDEHFVVECVRGVRFLKELRVETHWRGAESKVTGALLGPLLGSKSATMFLESLALPFTAVGDAFVACVARSCPSLRVLNLSECERLTDDCVKSVVLLRQLEELHLGRTHVGDAGFAILGEGRKSMDLPRLRKFNRDRNLESERSAFTEAGLTSVLIAAPLLE
jgi:hypothetical protein